MPKNSVATTNAAASPANAARGAEIPQTNNPSSTTIGSPATNDEQQPEPAGS